VDQQQIKGFIDAMMASDLSEMAFSQDGWTLRLARRGGVVEATSTAASSAASSASSSASSSTTAASPSAPVRPAPAAPAAPTLLAAPLFGVVHLQQAPGDPPFVSVGQPVKEGQTLCVIEAMKVFNEVRAEHDCSVAEVLVVSGQEVEAGQPLLRFAP